MPARCVTVDDVYTHSPLRTARKIAHISWGLTGLGIALRLLAWSAIHESGSWQGSPMHHSFGAGVVRR